MKPIHLLGPALIIAGLLFWLCGCATLDAKIDLPDGSHVEIKTATLLKNIKIDPNDGAMSIVSPEAPGIIEAILGGIAGWVLAGG